MPFGLRSLRRRIIAFSLLLALLLLGAGGYADRQVRIAVAQAHKKADLQQSFKLGFAELKNTVFSLEGGLYRYAMVQDGAARAKVEWRLRDIHQQASLLQHSSLLSARNEIREDFASLHASLKQLTDKAQNVLEIIAVLDKRFPASSIITEHMFPLSQTFNAILEEALLAIELETEDPLTHVFHDQLKEIRYQWSQQLSTGRMYIANRSGMFGYSDTGLAQLLTDREYYVVTIRGKLSQIKQQAQAQKAPMLQRALSQLNDTLDEFENSFAQVVAIQQTGQWRGDIAELRDTIQPMLAEMRHWFGRMEAHLDELDAHGMEKSLQLAEGLTSLLWSISFFAILMLVAGYLAYEFAIRRPIDQLIVALRALGQGAAYTPLMKTYAYETEALLMAFCDMQNQVQEREARLISILDNASDGIITINEIGVIETFNAAAEKLFQYQAEDIVGQKVNILMPPSVSVEHDDYIRDYLKTGEQRIIGTELNVTAKRKDGSLFPMSIKVSEMRFDGRRYFTALVSDISERKAMLEHLRHLAEHDSLTGLYNRQYFADEMERVFQRTSRQDDDNHALLYIDLDNFKLVNDSLGHLAGDRVLIEVAELVAKRSRKTDLIARLGGDEFAVLLYDVDQQQAIAAAEGYRQQLASYNFFHDGRVVDIGCSIGLAMFAADVVSREELMVRADIACHMAKQAGRNSVHIYHADDRADMDSQFADMGWARRIKQAIDNDGFTFALQPIFDIATQQISSYELLLRMYGDDGEILLPTSFIPAAERFGLIQTIDRWVVQQGLRLLIDGVLQSDMRLSINLSTVSIGDQELLQLIKDGVARHGVEPWRLTFEITETVAMAKLTEAIEFLANLRVLGCATALDDFGVGYSSFAYLKELPVDYVKIDGSFVRDIARDKVQLAMVKSMNDIAHAMGKWTVAEYVENEEILQLLTEIGVDYAQGYFTGRPQLLDDMKACV